jgi:hypothetical protein
MSISSINSTTASSTPAATATTTTAAAPVYSASPLATARQQNANVASAVSLSSDASIVSILGGSSAPTTYSAQGFLNAINTAGTTTTAATVPTKGTDTSQVAQLANDAGVVGTLSGTAAQAGVYSSSGGLQNLSASVSATYASILKTNPNLSSTFVSASYNSGIVGTIA